MMTVALFGAHEPTGLQLLSAVAQSTGQTWLTIESVDPRSAAAAQGLKRGLMLRTLQGRCVVGLQSHELLFLPFTRHDIVSEPSIIYPSLHINEHKSSNLFPEQDNSPFSNFTNFGHVVPECIN